MRQIFVFTAGDKNARSHLDDSILTTVPFEWMREALGPEQTDYYRSLMPEQDGFHAWGAVPGERNDLTWAEMQVGDLVLTVYGNVYHFFSTVVGKLRSRELAQKIWGVDDDGDTWEWMYLLTPPQRISVHVMSEPVVGYLNRGYRGFAKIADYKVEAILQQYGSLDHFVHDVFGQQIPPTPIERELERVREEADKTAPFDPTDMVDGRKKVLAEVVCRQGQPKFRQALIDAYEGKCAVTGCDVEAVLEAAHIVSYSGKT